MDELTSTTGAVAVAAAVLAAAALIVGILALMRLRRLRTDQQVLLGEEGQDLVTHAAGLDRDFRALNRHIEGVAARLTQRLDTAEQRLNGAIAHTSLVRYDAYNEMSGRQSTTVALLDDRRCGIVISTILHRDTARMYAKRVIDGSGELELSPEENEAIRLALSTPAPPTAPDAQ